MKTKEWIAIAALVLGLLAAGLRRSPPETPLGVKKPSPASEVREAVVPASLADPMLRTAERLGVSEVDAFVATSREVVCDLRRLQVRRQSEWALDVDQQTRLEWEERFDADRKAVVGRLDRFLDEGAGHREFRDQIDTWAATVWARDNGIYR